MPWSVSFHELYYNFNGWFAFESLNNILLLQVTAEAGSEGREETIAKPVVAGESGGVKQDWRLESSFSNKKLLILCG